MPGRPAVANLRLRVLDRTDPGLDRKHRAVTMPHDTGASVGKLQILHRGEKCLDFGSLRQKLPRKSVQDIGQWIIDLVGLTKRNNVPMPEIVQSCRRGPLWSPGCRRPISRDKCQNAR